MTSIQKILPATLAKIMGHSPTWVRVSMQRGLLPVGIAQQKNEHSGRWSYDIRPNKVAEYLGISVEELITLLEEAET